MQYLPRPTCLPTRSLIHNGACRPRWVCVSLSLSLRLTLPSTAAVQCSCTVAELIPIGLIPLDCKWDASREFIRFGRRDGDRKHDHWHEWHYCTVGILVCPKHPSGFKSIEAVSDPQSMISDHRAPSLPSIHPSRMHRYLHNANTGVVVVELTAGDELWELSADFNVHIPQF